MIISVIFSILGIALCIYTNKIWRKLTEKSVINAQTVSLRRKYRNISVAGLIVFIVFVSNVVEPYFESFALFEFLIIPMVFMNGRLLFEPYYSDKDVSKIKRLCLYLRPFSMDSESVITNKFSLPIFIEKVLCNELEQKVAQVFCIGNPNSSIPTTLATSCVYASDRTWKNTVNKLYKKASYCTIRVGSTEGCLWELDHCFEQQYIYKTIFIVDGTDSLAILNEQIALTEALEPIAGSTKLPALIYRHNDGWVFKNISQESDVKDAVAELIKQKPFDRKEIKREELCWSGALSFFMNPFAHIYFNGWKKKSIMTYAVQLAVIGIIAFSLLAYTDSIWIALVAAVLGHGFFSLLAPDVSWESKIWGGESIFMDYNKTMLMWLIAYTALNVIAPFIAFV